MSPTVVWLIDPDTLFETHWIRSLFVTPFDLSEVILPSFDEAHAIESAIFVVNHSIVYDEFFEKHTHKFGVIHISDETLGAPSSFYHLENCSFVWRNYHHPVLSALSKVHTFGLGMKAGVACADQRLSMRWYHWCFAGNLHAAHRVECLKSFETVIPFTARTTTGAGFASSPLSTQEYKAMLENSKFALCPVGQCNLDTFRFYEAMATGAIPITLRKTNDQPYDYWHHMFPWVSSIETPWVSGDTWQECYDQVKSLLQDPISYVKKYDMMINFWETAKARWSTRFRDSFLSM